MPVTAMVRDVKGVRRALCRTAEMHIIQSFKRTLPAESFRNIREAIDGGDVNEVMLALRRCVS